MPPQYQVDAMTRRVIIGTTIALVGASLIHSATAHAHSETADVQTASLFLQECRANHTLCLEYVRGAIDGIIWLQITNKTRYQLCFRHSESYLEIADAYVGYLNTMAIEAANRDDPHGYLSEDNMLILSDFLASRYGCQQDAPKSR